MQTGWLNQNNNWYYLNSGGSMATGWSMLPDNNWYHFNTSGVMDTGWFQDQDDRFFMNASGVMQTGWVKLSDGWYYFDATGKMATGWINYKNDSYYLSDTGLMVTGKQVIDGVTYVFDSNGALTSGNSPIKNYMGGLAPVDLGEDFYAHIGYPNGGWNLTLDGRDYQVLTYKQTTSPAQVWQFIRQNDGSYKIVNKKTGMCLDVAGGGSANGTKIIIHDGHNGDNQRWFIYKVGNGYALRPKCASDSVLDITNASKESLTFTQLYKFNGSAAQVFTIDVINNIDSNGTVQTGWVKRNDTWFYYNKNGAMQTGWLNLNNTWYYLNESGAMQTGWVRVSGVWYYLDASGAMQTGWLKDGGRWYYLSDSGAMVTGSQIIDGLTYGFDNSGALTSGTAPLDYALNGMAPANLGEDFYAHIGYPNGGWNLTLDGVDVRVLTYNKTTSPAQVWRFIRQNDGSYKIVNKKTGKCLDVRNGSTQNGTMIRIYEDNGSNAQRWFVYKVGNGYVLRPKCAPNSVLDIPSASKANLTLTQLYTFNGSAAQIFTIDKSNSTASTYTGGMAGDGYIRAYGIDVSEWQGSGFDFQNLKNNGYSYVILRCGTSNRKDYRFEEYYAAARAAGLNIGVYFYSYATNAAEASRDADLCLSYIAGKKFEYPVYFDFEDPSARSYDANTAYNICTTFLDKVASKGYLAGLYSSASWIDPNYHGWVPAASICSKYECWIANYYNDSPNNVKSANYASTYGMYQYTSSNYVGGVGPLDTNVCYKDYPTIIKENHLNGY